MVEKYGFVYLWFDRKHKRYYVGCHWGTVDDGYICSSRWMRKSYKRRPQDFKRRILKTNLSRTDMYVEEQRYLNMIKSEEKKVKYYNLSLFSKKPWHAYPESVKTVGQKISHSKKGKSLPCTPEKAAAISAAKKGKALTEEHKAALTGIKKKPHTDDWKQENSERMKEQWNNGSRKRAEPKQSMSREEQDKLCSEKLKSRWSDPLWAEKQKEKLRVSAKKRWEHYYINKLKQQEQLAN